MKKLFLPILLSLVYFQTFAQKSDGTAKSLAKADVAFSAYALKNGLHAAYQEFAANDAIVFRPNAINVRKYTAGNADIKGFSRAVNYTRMSRSGDWGVTTGSYQVDSDPKTYGHFVSVWRGAEGDWKLVIDMDAQANKPLQKVEAKIVDPKDKFSPKFASAKELKTSREIIYTTEKTLNTTLKTYGAHAFSGFLNEDSRLLFPGTDPIVGKEHIQAFHNRMVDKISLKTLMADKALGGELAYSYGVATIDYKTDLRESFNYLYIWERQSDFSWNIMLQIYTLAER